jgi:hypothetical protein
MKGICFSEYLNMFIQFLDCSSKYYQPITYYWTVRLMLDHLYLVGKLTSLKNADTKVSGF